MPAGSNGQIAANRRAIESGSSKMADPWDRVAANGGGNGGAKMRERRTAAMAAAEDPEGGRGEGRKENEATLPLTELNVLQNAHACEWKQVDFLWGQNKYSTYPCYDLKR